MFQDHIYDVDDHYTESDIVLDVPFVPTDDAVIEIMLNLGNVGPKDVLYDLGSGDGRILITAARDRNTRGIGIEVDPQRIADAMENAADSRVEYLLDFIEESIFEADFSEATVVTLYLLSSINVQLRPQLLSQLRPGTPVISHAFGMGDWKADEQVDFCGISVYKWIIPAQVEGAWEWVGLDGETYYVELEQKYQEVTGNAWLGDLAVDLKSAKLRGDTLELKIQKDETTSINSFTLHFENNELQSVLHDA